MAVVISAGQTVSVSSGQADTGDIIDVGGYEIVLSGGSASDTTDYGVQDVDSGAVAVGTTLYEYGNITVSSGGHASGVVITNYYASMDVEFGATAVDTVASDGDIYVDGVTVGTELQGEERVDSGGLASRSLVSNHGVELVESGGRTVSAVLSSGGLALVESNGATTGTLVRDGGLETIWGGGVGTGVTLAGGTIVSSGGILWTIFGDDDIGLDGDGAWSGASIASGARIASGGCEIVDYRAEALDTTVSSGGIVVVTPRGTQSGTTVEAGGRIVSTGVVLFEPYSGVTIYATSATGLVTSLSLNNDWDQPTIIYVLPGGLATSSTVEPFCLQEVYGRASDTIDYNQDVVFSGGVDVAAKDYYSQIVYAGGKAISATVAGPIDYAYQYVSSGGVSSDTYVAYLGIEQVDPGGTAIGTVVSGESGYAVLTDSGRTIRATLEAGSDEAVESGGVAIDTTVRSGGVEYVSSGGTESGVLLGSGGAAVLSEGAALEGAIVFAGWDASIDIGGLGMPTISGFNVTDKISLLDVGYDPTESAKLLSGNVLLVSGPSGSARIQLDPDEDFSGSKFSLAESPDYGDSGTLITISGPIVIRSGQTSSGGALAAAEVETVLSGGLAIGTIVSSGGRMVVSSGGTASRLVISSGGAETLSSGGVAEENVISSGGVEVVLAGAVSSKAIVRGGTDAVSSGGVDVAVTVSSGGSVVVKSGGVVSGLLLAAGGQVIDGGSVVISGALRLSGSLSGDGSLVQAAAGDLVLGAADAGFVGHAVLSGGTIELAAAGALGTGSVAFTAGSAPETLQIDAGNAPAAGGVFANTISNFSSSGDYIDLRGITFVAGAVASVSGTTMMLTEGGETYRFRLAGTIGGPLLPVTSDGHGGTLIDPLAAGMAQTMAAFAAPGAAGRATLVLPAAGGTGTLLAAGGMLSSG